MTFKEGEAAGGQFNPSAHSFLPCWLQPVAEGKSCFPTGTVVSVAAGLEQDRNLTRPRAYVVTVCADMRDGEVVVNSVDSS